MEYQKAFAHTAHFSVYRLFYYSTSNGALKALRNGWGFGSLCPLSTFFLGWCLRKICINKPWCLERVQTWKTCLPTKQIFNLKKSKRFRFCLLRVFSKGTPLVSNFILERPTPKSFLCKKSISYTKIIFRLQYHLIIIIIDFSQAAA